MFGFGKTIKDPLADVEVGRALVRRVPGQRSAGRPRASSLTELGALAERRRAPHARAARGGVPRSTRMRASLRKNADRRNTSSTRPRSSKIENQLWSALFDLTQAFLRRYQRSRAKSSTTRRAASGRQLLPELIARQIVHLGLDAKIRLYRYEQWIPAKWAELHALFTLACSRQIERAAAAARRRRQRRRRSSTNT